MCYIFLCAFCLEKDKGYLAFGGQAGVGEWSADMTRGACDILNYSRIGKEGRNNRSSDILKGKEDRGMCTIALVHWEPCFFTHPLIQSWSQEKAILGENLTQLSSVEPLFDLTKGLFNKYQPVGYFLIQFVLDFRSLTFSAWKNGQTVTAQEWRGHQFLDHQLRGRQFALTSRIVNYWCKWTVKTQRLNVEINI